MYNSLEYTIKAMDRIFASDNPLKDGLDHRAELAAKLASEAEKYFDAELSDLLSDPESIREALTEMPNDKLRALVNEYPKLKTLCASYLKTITWEAALKKAEQALEDK